MAKPTVGWLVGWLLAGWLVGWLAGWLVGLLAGWLAGWLLGGLAGFKHEREVITRRAARTPLRAKPCCDLIELAQAQGFNIVPVRRFKAWDIVTSRSRAPYAGWLAGCKLAGWLVG